DEAYYFYFQVPDDSEKLPDALFEAAWSMFQKGEWEAARALLDQFDRLFPHSALAPESAVLRANLDLTTCAFDRARKELQALVRDFRTVLGEVERALGDPARRRLLYGHLLGREKAPGVEGRLLELLKIDARFFRFHEYVAGLDRELAQSRRTITMWRELAE